MENIHCDTASKPEDDDTGQAEYCQGEASCDAEVILMVEAERILAERKTET